MKIAVIGTGVSGLLAARLLCGEHVVTVFEAADYAGGHANTVECEAFGRRFAVDTGFMVFNQRTYPNFCRMLRMLGVQAQASDMSFSVSCQQTELEYQGSSLNGIFAQRRNLLRPTFYRLLADVVQFNRESRSFLRDSSDDMTLGEFLAHGGYSVAFRDQYVVPMTAAIWSATRDKVLEFSARFLFRFFENHGLIQLRDRPQWQTIPDGSQRYVRALVEPFRETIRYSTPVAEVTRDDGGATIRTADGDNERFEAVVLATHADDSLRLLADADAVEREVLSAFPYQHNEAVLHTDVSMLPRSRRAWASWNYFVPRDEERPPSVTYDLSRLQRLEAPSPICVTLNPQRPVTPDAVLQRFNYRHPIFDARSVAAQRRYDEINHRRRTYFCGAYWRNGFHEDGVVSALAVGRYFGKGLEQCAVASTEVTSGIAASVQ